MKIINYNKIFENHTQINSWKSEESFPLKKIDEWKRKELEKYEITEYVSEGMLGKRSQDSFLTLINQFEKEIIEVFNQDEKNKYLFTIEHGSAFRSAIRTYKGIIDKKEISSLEFLQQEFFLSDNESRIACVAELSESNFSYLSKFFFDSNISFIISSKMNYLNVSFLKKIITLFNVKGWTHINLLNVILEFCPRGDFIYRIGGNDGEEYWSLQLFKYKADFKINNDLSH